MMLLAGALFRNHFASDANLYHLSLIVFVNEFRVLQGHNCLLANHLDFTNNSFKRSYYLLKWIATSLYIRNMFEQQTIKLGNGLEIRLTVATPQVSAILENM